MYATNNTRYRFIKTFGIFPVQHAQSDENQGRSLSKSLVSDRIGFIIYSGKYYLFNVSVNTLQYYASLIKQSGFIYYDGTFKRYVHDHKHTYRCVDACPEIEIPHELFIDVDRCLAFNLKQVKGFDNPSDAIDFIISRVGYHPYYLRSYINRGIDGHVINNIHKKQLNMKSQKEWHVINDKGEHITIPYNEVNEVNEANQNKAKYQLDVEWYRQNGYRTQLDHENRIKQIKDKYGNS